MIAVADKIVIWKRLVILWEGLFVRTAYMCVCVCVPSYICQDAQYFQMSCMAPVSIYSTWTSKDVFINESSTLR